MRVLVCGGRHYADRAYLYYCLDELDKQYKIDVVIAGGAPGADQLAEEWAIERGKKIIRERADWKKYGKAAGPVRNQKMLDDHQPQYTVAFPGGKGTSDMVRRSIVKGVIVIEANKRWPSAGRVGSIE